MAREELGGFLAALLQRHAREGADTRSKIGDITIKRHLFKLIKSGCTVDEFNAYYTQKVKNAKPPTDEKKSDNNDGDKDMLEQHQPATNIQPQSTTSPSISPAAPPITVPPPVTPKTIDYLNMELQNDYTSLQLAISLERVDLVSLLLTLGADPNANHTANSVPLAAAMIIGNPSIMRMVLEAGADPTRLFPGTPENPSEEHPPFCAAVGENKWFSVRFVMEYYRERNLDMKSLVDLRDGDGDPVVSLAVQSKSPSILISLVEAKANVNAVQPETGITALHLAANADNVEMMLYLVQNGADPNIRTTDADPKYPYELINERKSKTALTALTPLGSPAYTHRLVQLEKAKEKQLERIRLKYEAEARAIRRGGASVTSS